MNVPMKAKDKEESPPPPVETVYVEKEEEPSEMDIPVETITPPLRSNLASKSECVEESYLPPKRSGVRRVRFAMDYECKPPTVDTRPTTRCSPLQAAVTTTFIDPVPSKILVENPSTIAQDEEAQRNDVLPTNMESETSPATIATDEWDCSSTISTTMHHVKQLIEQQSNFLLETTDRMGVTASWYLEEHSKIHDIDDFSKELEKGLVPFHQAMATTKWTTSGMLVQ
jgi:hypothetical protein